MEIVIVGGGFAGAATAYELACAGSRDVVVLERETTWGYHASGRNAALGRQITELDGCTDYTVRGMSFLRQPPDGFSEVPLVSQHGSMLLCDDLAARERLLGQARTFDVPCEAFDAAVLGVRWPRLADVRCAGGVFFPGDGVIDVHALLHGYIAGARSRGVGFELGCEVLGFRQRGEEVEVSTSSGPILARAVVIAAGAWAGRLGNQAGAPRGFSPIRRHLFSTEPVAELDTKAPFVWHLGAREFYVRPEGTGLLVSGCDETKVEPCDATTAPGAIEELAERLDCAAPSLAELGVARSWACLRTFSDDGVPVVNWDTDVPWLFWVAGLGGHGATASHAIGETAANRLRTRLAQRLA